MFYKKILFQSFYFKISHLIECVTFHFFVIICEIYLQFLSENTQLHNAQYTMHLNNSS